jgi:hypothetical protein
VFRRLGFALSLSAWLCGLSASASANGRFPAADQLVFWPEQPSSLALRTTFGLLFSEDAGDSWDWVCESAVGYSGTQDPMLGAMADGVLVAALNEGIARSSGSACSWSFAQADALGAQVIDVSVKKSDPRTAVALAWDPASDSAGAAYRGRLLRTEDNGEHFERLPVALDPSVLMLTVDLAPSDEQRMYLSGTRSTDDGRVGLLLVSRDGGNSFSEREVPFDKRVDQGLYIAAVDPSDADTLYLRTSSAGAGRLIVSRDGGETFTTPFVGAPVRGFALSPDGQRVYFGGTSGIYAGLRDELVFEQRSSVRCLCLTAIEDTLYACSDEYSGFTVGASRDGGFSFEPKLHLKSVRGPLACADDTSAGSCAAEWESVGTLLGIMPEVGAEGGAGGVLAVGGDAGSPDTGSGGSGATGTPAARAAGGGCASAGSAPHQEYGAVLSALSMLLLVSRRRRR